MLELCILVGKLGGSVWIYPDMFPQENLVEPGTIGIELPGIPEQRVESVADAKDYINSLAEADYIESRLGAAGE